MVQDGVYFSQVRKKYQNCPQLTPEIVPNYQNFPQLTPKGVPNIKKENREKLKVFFSYCNRACMCN